MNTRIKNIDILTPEGVKRGDLWLSKGKISFRAPKKAEGYEVLDGEGLTALPGFVDLHVHFREPGQTRKEDIASGCAAAVAGGFTTVCCMPNTTPPVDTVAAVKFILDRAGEVGLCRVRPIGCISKGQKGEELAPIGGMAEAGAAAFSDDGMPVSNANLMRMAMLYGKNFDALMISHCEDKALAGEGVANEGASASEAGLPGICAEAEEVMVARECILAEHLGCRVHLAHISTKGSVDLIRFFKQKGVAVTAETCPHYVAATDRLILGHDAMAKVNPPLRSEADRLAVIEGLRDGTLDCISTDHAPHHRDDKEVEFNYAANGISGLETAFALCYTYLVKPGHLTLAELSRKMSANPCAVLRQEGGRLEEGAVADLTLADLGEVFQVDRSKFRSKGKNTPFEGWTLHGKIKYTFVGGELKYHD